MKLDDKTIYPYPIWGWTDDFVGDEPKANLDITLDIATNEIVITLSMENSNDDVSKLIAHGCAKYHLVVECTKAYFTKKIQSDRLPLEIRFPSSSVYNTFKCSASIVAIKRINGFPVSHVSEDYGGIVDFDKGSTIAYLGEKTVSLRAINNSINLNDFISYKCIEGISTFECKFEGDKIQIGCPVSVFEKFEDFDGEFPSLTNGMIVRDAFIQGVMKIKDSEYADKDWAMFLTEYIQSLPDIEIDMDDDTAISYEQAAEVVDMLLSNPRERAIKDAPVQIDTEENE